MSLDIRASDEDRQRTIAALQRHTEVGRLSLDEFTDRVDAVCAARTLGDLAVITRDLPAAAGDAAMATPADPDAARREFLLIFMIAAVTLLLLGVFMAMTRGGG